MSQSAAVAAVSARRQEHDVTNDRSFTTASDHSTMNSQIIQTATHGTVVSIECETQYECICRRRGYPA